jgi:hypothetical protein
MPTIINISAGTLFTLGSTSSSSADENNNLGSTGSMLSATATTVALSGDQSLIVNAKAEDLHTTKAYVQSLSDEERMQMMSLLDEKEEVITRESVKKLTLSK